MIYFLGRNTLFQDNYFKTCSKEDIVKYCASKEILGLDIETTRKYPKNMYDETVYKPGLDPYVTKICMLQIGDLENQYIIDARFINCSFLKDILSNEKILKVGHNLKFEGKHILHNYDIEIKNVWDTMICERILYNGLPYKYSLLALADRYLGIKSVDSIDLFNQEEEISEFEEDFENELDLIDYKPTKTVYLDKSIRTNFINIGDREFTKEEIEYGTNDILYPIQIYHKQKLGRDVDGILYRPDIGFKLENKFTQSLAKIELRGIKVDVQKWLDLYEGNTKIFHEKLSRLNTWVATYFPKFTLPPNLFSEVAECGIMWSSPKEVIKFAKHLGICPREKSKFTGLIEDTVGAKAMFKLLINENKDKFFKNEELEFGDKDDYQSFILNFLLVKKYQQLTTTFGKEWLRHIHPITKRVHTNFIQLVSTGRMSNTNPNLMQIPSGKVWRECFICTEGKKLIATDFNSQEVRIAAEVTNVQLLQDFFIKGHPIFKEDFHSFTATQMYRVLRNDPNLIINKKDHAEERATAKNMTFKLQFGGSAYTVAQDLGVDIEAGTKFYDSYFDGFPGLKENFEVTKKLAVKRGWVELDPYTKKRYFFPHFEKMKETYKKAQSYYPEDYQMLSKEEKQKVKDQLKIDSPELSGLWKEYMILKGKLERCGLNYRIQANASTMTKIAAMLIDKDNPVEYGLLLMIHDEMVEEYPEKMCEKRSEFTKEKFAEAGKYTCKKVPMSGTSEIGTYWIH